MAILIVDDETTTRAALRELLHALGHAVILEARNGVEAMRCLETDRARIRMILADWEMPYMNGLILLSKITEDPSLSLIPFVLVTSDLPESKLKWHQKTASRLDGYLIKPFRLNALKQTMAHAHAHRTSRRTALAVSGNPSKALKAAVSSKKNKRWTEILPFSSFQELEKIFAGTKKPGAIIIDPLLSTMKSPSSHLFLSRFKKTPLGSQIPVICASREPEEIFPFRTSSQYFVKSDASAEDWEKAMKAVAQWTDEAWETELLFQELKAAIQKKDASSTRGISKLLVSNSPLNAEAHNARGEILLSSGWKKDAASHFRAALDLNPCLPRSYIKLMEATEEEADSERTKIAASAVAYCPQSPDVLMRAAHTFKECGDLTGCRSALQRVFALNADHPGAKELMSAISPADSP